MRPLLASLARIDWNAVDRPFAIRCAIGVTAGILVGFATGQPLFAVACGMGAMCTGFASLQGFYQTRVATMIAMAVAMAISTVAGTSAAHSVPVEIAALALWGAAYGLFSALGAAASAVALNATIALVIFSNFPLAPQASLECGAFVVAGGLIQTLLVVFSWPIQRYPEERHALAGAFASLASYARSIDCMQPQLPPASFLTAVQHTLADPRPFGRRTAYAAFQTLLDEAERVRATLGRIAATSCAAYPPLRDLTAQALDTIARSLQKGRAPDNASLHDRLNVESDDEQIRALFGQLRAIWRNLSLPFEGRSLGNAALPAIEWFDFAESVARLRSNLHASAPFGRHAIRLAATLAFTGALAHLLPLQRGYWMTLTAALVLRPDFTTTVSRGIARILGTLIGVVIATVLVLALPDTPGVTLGLAIFFAAIGYATFQMNYALYTITVTSYVVFILALIGTPERAAVFSRMIATLAGGTIAMLAYAVFPTWEAPQTRALLLALVEADRRYARTLFTGLIDPTVRNVAQLREERAILWSTRAKAEASLERMLAEPPSNDDIPRERALGLMAATQRIGLANLALATMYEAPSTPALPELASFAVALETAFASTEAFLREEPAAARSSPLRDLYAQLRRDLRWRDRDSLLVTLDMMVDAVNTMNGLAQTEPQNSRGLPA